MHRVGPAIALCTVLLVGACSPAATPQPTSTTASPGAPEPTGVPGSSEAVTGPGASTWGLGGAEPRPLGPGDIAAAVAAWQRFEHPAYNLHVRFGCECLLTGDVVATVRDGVVVEVTQDGRRVELASVQGFPLTIDAMLAEAQATLDGGGSVTGSFDDFGEPGVLDLDRDPQAVDDELHIEVGGIEFLN